ncbi:MAG: hypothetical protein Alis3KO_35460 [Aliiglaciecola sp.]
MLIGERIQPRFTYNDYISIWQIVLIVPEALSDQTFKPIALIGLLYTFFRQRYAKSRMI